MIVIVSPSKTQCLSLVSGSEHTQPCLLEKTAILIERLKQCSSDELAGLMHISDRLADLTHRRIQTFSLAA